MGMGMGMDMGMGTDSDEVVGAGETIKSLDHTDTARA
jgi:hypothetical protein